MGYYTVLSQIDVGLVPKRNQKSLHIFERSDRLRSYAKLFSNNFIHAFLVDTGHEKGKEIHAINNKGLVYVYNKKSKHLITITHPRPKQLKRYFKQLNLNIPEDIEALCISNRIRNEKNDLNNLK